MIDIWLRGGGGGGSGLFFWKNDFKLAVQGDANFEVQSQDYD